MPGQIKRTIDRILHERAKANPILATTTKTKLMLKGIAVDSYTESSPDDPEILQKLRALAAELGVTV